MQKWEEWSEEKGDRVEWGGLPPLLSCEEAPSINSGSPHTARNRFSFVRVYEESFRTLAYDFPVRLFMFSGHALHKKGLQRQIGVGTLVSNQERRAPLVPRINRLSTAGFVPPSV